MSELVRQELFSNFEFFLQNLILDYEEMNKIENHPYFLKYKEILKVSLNELQLARILLKL